MRLQCHVHAIAWYGDCILGNRESFTDFSFFFGEGGGMDTIQCFHPFSRKLAYCSMGGFPLKFVAAMYFLPLKRIIPASVGL